MLFSNFMFHLVYYDIYILILVKKWIIYQMMTSQFEILS